MFDEKETIEVRFNRAMREVRKAGIVAKRNVKACCRGCAVIENPNDEPVFWSFGGQGAAVSITGNNSSDNVINFQHNGLMDNEVLTSAGVQVVTVFAKNGFAAMWENESRVIKVVVK